MDTVQFALEKCYKSKRSMFFFIILTQMNRFIKGEVQSFGPIFFTFNENFVNGVS